MAIAKTGWKRLKCWAMVLLITLILWGPGGAIAGVIGGTGGEAIAGASPPVLVALNDQDRAELEQYRLDQRMHVLIERDLATNPDIRDRIELEVDRAFDRTTTILNVLLMILTAVPILLALGVWLLRRSVISELVAEVRSQLEKEVFLELKKQRDASLQELESSRLTALQQLTQMVEEAETVLGELKTQIGIANQEIDELKAEAALRLQSMVNDAQAIKDQTIQELTGILPPSTQDPLPPENQPKLGRLTAFLETLRSAVPQLTFTATDYAKQGSALFFDSRYEDAIAAYDRALSLNGDLYEAWFGRGSTLVILQRYEEAIAAYQDALRIRPNAYEAWLGQAAVLRKLQKPEEAIAAYRHALTLKPDDPLLWFNQGNTFLELGNAAEAIAAYDQVLSLKPDFVRAGLNRSVALRQLGRWEEAIAAAGDVLRLKPNDADALYNQALSYSQLGQLEPALTCLEQALQSNPLLADRIRDEPSLMPLTESDRLRSWFSPRQ